MKQSVIGLNNEEIRLPGVEESPIGLYQNIRCNRWDPGCDGKG